MDISRSLIENPREISLFVLFDIHFDQIRGFQGCVTPPTKGVGPKMYIFGISIRSSITLYGLSLDLRGLFRMRTLCRVYKEHPLDSDFSKFNAIFGHWIARVMERPIPHSNRIFTLFHMIEKNWAGIEAPKKFSRFCEKFY